MMMVMTEVVIGGESRNWIRLALVYGGGCGQRVEERATLSGQFMLLFLRVQDSTIGFLEHFEHVVTVRVRMMMMIMMLLLLLLLLV